MTLTDEQIGGLGVALNEASFLSIGTNLIHEGLVQVTLLALSWDDEADEPSNQAVQLSLSGVSRIVASLRNGMWNDKAASVDVFAIDELTDRVFQMGPSDLYGWEFIDTEPLDWLHHMERPSVDHRTGEPAPAHHLHLFKEQFQPTRTLDLRIWFNDILITTEDDNELALDDFIRRGKRWWEAMHAGDRRTSSSGIVSGGAPTSST